MTGSWGSRSKIQSEYLPSLISLSFWVGLIVDSIWRETPLVKASNINFNYLIYYNLELMP